MQDKIPFRYEGRTVLAIGAHPDDIELGMGGTAARLRQAGAKLVMVVGCIPTDYETRVAEVKRGAEILGGELRVLFNHHCSRIEDVKSYDLVKKLDDLIKEFKPAAMFTHGPADFHWDHTLVYNACQAAQRLGAIDFFCYYPTSCRPVPTKFHPQVYVDITETMDIKMAAINAHTSQFAGRGLKTDFFREIAHEYGILNGVPYAEGLEVSHMMLA